MIETARSDTTIFAPTTRWQSMVAAHLVTPTWLARRRLAVATARTTGWRVSNGSFHCDRYRQTSWIWRAVSSNRPSTPVAKFSPRPSSRAECSAGRANSYSAFTSPTILAECRELRRQAGGGSLSSLGRPIAAEQLYSGGTRAGIRAIVSTASYR